MASSPFRVLYVEDDEDDVLFMRRAFREVCPSIELAVARDGEQAVEYLSDHRPAPDWVILDLKMPRRSGAEVLEWIRGHPILKGLRVTILSSSPEQADRARMKDLGIEEYVVKPTNYAGLLEITRSFCKRWGVAEA